jgi:cytochrome c oxidase subunit IV
MKLKFLFIFTLMMAIIVPATAKVTTVDHIQTPELLYISIAGLFFLLALIVYDARSPFVEGQRYIKLEYFLKVVMGGLSLFLAFLVSSWLGGRGIILLTGDLSYDVQSQAMSIFFLIWGLLMTIYTVGVLLLYFEEANRQIDRGLGDGRISTR